MQTPALPRPTFTRRNYLRILGLTVFLGSVLACLEGRLIRLQVRRHRELKAAAQGFSRTVRHTMPFRGEIRDRTGQPLAVSLPAKAFLVNLAVCSNRLEECAATLGPILQIPVAQLRKNMDDGLALYRRGRGPTPLKALMARRGVSIEEYRLVTNGVAGAAFGFDLNRLTKQDANQLQKLREESLLVQDDQVRFYPLGPLLAHVLGFVGLAPDARALEGKQGVERSLNPALGGQPGKCVSEQDARGRELPERRALDLATIDGSHVVLTIDIALQQLAERILAEAFARHSPANASLIMMRPQTGEILAWAVLPEFNPQDPSAGDPGWWWNHGHSSMHEPGSTVKPLILAAALSEGIVTLDTSVFGENGYWALKGGPVKDSPPHGWITLRQALPVSSDIVFAKLGVELGAGRLQKWYRRFGFGQYTHVALPTETPGYFEAIKPGDRVRCSRLGFGYSVSASQLQMLAAYCALAADGRLMQPMLVRRIEAPDGKVQEQAPVLVRQVVSPEVARAVREAMVGVVTSGTGKAAALQFYTVAGKTGTAEVMNPAAPAAAARPGRAGPGRNAYDSSNHYASFIGMVPAGRPEVCVAVSILKPRNGNFGATACAPWFRAFMELAAPQLGIQPDKGAGPMAATGPARLPQGSGKTITATPGR